MKRQFQVKNLYIVYAIVEFDDLFWCNSDCNIGNIKYIIYKISTNLISVITNIITSLTFATANNLTL